MRKGWQSKFVHENAWGLHFKRWYIVAPSGNVYNIYRGAYFDTIFLLRDVNDCKKSLRIGMTYNEALKKVYEFEEKTKTSAKFSTFISNLTKEIKKKQEYKSLYEENNDSYSYYSM